MKRILFSAIMALGTLCVQSQEGIHQGQLSNPIPENFFTASPDVAAFQKFNTLPVSLYTGKINVSIPIFEVRSGNISIPISISYNSGGVKVDDFASSVGLNWNLNAGGNIVRMIKHLPDNEASFSLSAESDWDNGIMLNPLLTAYGYNRKSAVDLNTLTIWGATNRHAIYVDDTSYPADSSTPYLADIQNTPGNNDATQDLSPDVFNVNAPGLSTKFTSINTSNYAIYPSNNNGFTTTFLTGSGEVMESLVLDRRTVNGNGFFASPAAGDHYGRIYHPIKDFFEFNIINAMGVKYKFADEEISEHYYAPTNTQAGGHGWTAYQNALKTMISNNYSKKIHTWNLTSITDPKSNKTVQFVYDTYVNNNTVRNTYRQPDGQSLSGTYISNQCKFGLNSGVTAYSHTGEHLSWDKHIKRKRLNKITYDGGEIVFIYNHLRQDYLGEKALTEIQVKDINGAIIKKFRFNYSYFISKENCADTDCKRLKLESIDFLGTNNEYNSYTFDYEYTNPLPKRGSLEQDYLGYYNNNGYTGSYDAAPTLYYYAGQGIHSLLPFQRTNATATTTITGQLDFSPNTYSLTGLLKKITYPTGGSSEFEYENNTFHFQGATYTTGGARVKSQTLKENGTVVKKLDYEYVETSGNSSGAINNVPVYGIANNASTTNSLITFAAYNKPKGGIELTTGSFVGYSRVLEKETGNGYTEHLFSSPKLTPNTPEVRTSSTGSLNSPSNNSSCMTKLINNTPYPGIAYVDNDYKRGKLIQKKIFAENGSLLINQINTYTPRILSSIALQGDMDIHTVWNMRYRLSIASSIPVAQDLQTQTVTTQYLDGGTHVTTNQTVYDSSLPLPIETKIIDGSRTLINKYFYPFSSAIMNDTHMSDLRAQNRYAEMIKFEMYENTEKILTQNTNYKNFGSNLFLPESLGVSKGNNALTTNGTIDQRDANGNITEVRSETGVYTTLIYGYNGTLLIAKIENARLTDIPTSILNDVVNKSDLDIDTASEDNLRTALTNLRNHANLTDARVTTYTYDPLIGATSVTDARGRTSYYVYDPFHRLKYIKDHDGNVLSKNEYHYKN